MKIGFLLSGSGTTFENLFNKMKSMDTPGEIVVVISSRAGVKGIMRAQQANIPCHVVEYKVFNKNIELYSNEITKILSEYKVDLIVMGGFMSFYKIPKQFEGKVINVHPALIPSFCGQSMYGERVHKAVFESGVKVTGCTVHFVDNQYDHGPIIAQNAVEISENDTPETIQEKVVNLERELYPKVIDAIVRGNYKINNKKVFLKTGIY